MLLDLTRYIVAGILTLLLLAFYIGFIVVGVGAIIGRVRPFDEGGTGYLPLRRYFGPRDR